MNCLFCSSTKIENASYPRPTIFNNKQFNYKHCKDCGLIFINPLPAADDYGKMYSASYHDEFYFNETAPDYTRWYQLLEKYSNGKKILDFGCGDASFLKFFHQKNYQCTGVEYDPALVDRLRKENPGIQFYTVDEFWKAEEQYNIIFMGDVLEHIATPAEFLKSLRVKLSLNGLIAAQGPLENNSNLALGVRKLFSGLKGKNNIANHVPYHISFSNAKNQETVFQQAGLDTKYFNVFETTWPFPEKFSFSPATGFQYLVAKTSIVLSNILPGKMGNRFLYIGEKK
jgi:2-polyprenyl-3-methyl-5-hydroxy-6-metoxy-1,4-benzoquinol methylase